MVGVLGLGLIGTDLLAGVLLLISLETERAELDAVACTAGAECLLDSGFE